jgi:hypothetical protein
MSCSSAHHLPLISCLQEVYTDYSQSIGTPHAEYPAQAVVHIYHTPLNVGPVPCSLLDHMTLTICHLTERLQANGMRS